MKLIPLSKGQFAKVDDDDFEALSEYKWQAHWDKKAKQFRASRKYWKEGKIIEVSMHRQIMEAPVGVEVDHENRDTLDNQRGNLRLATHAENCRNRRPRSDSASGHKGLQWRPKLKQWVVRIQVDGKRTHVGCFRTLEAAKDAYRCAAEKFHGRFANAA